MSSGYDARASAHAVLRDRELRQSVLISRLRLATILPAAAGLVWLLSGGGSGAVLVLSGVLLCTFAALVVWHARVEERAAWFDAVRLANVHGQARLDRDWSRLPTPVPPADVDLTRHPFAGDLDLFGRASLLHWLGPSATVSGAACLANWLLVPAAVEEVRLRQVAVAELALNRQWRETLFAHGIRASGVSAGNLESFLKWAEGPGLFNGRERLWQIAVIALPLSIWVLLLGHITGVLAAAFWAIPLLFGLVLSFVTAKRVHGAFDRAGAGQRSLSRYAGLVQHAVTAPAQATRLQDVHARLTANGKSAPECMRRLNTLLSFAELRSGAAILHLPVQALTLWDFHVALALDRWRVRAGRHVRDWIDAVAELDALSSLAGVSFDNPSWCTPRFDDKRVLAAASLGHPLLGDTRRVVNDVTVGPPGSVLVITGSNMSGKSTLLRAMGLNVVLAQAGGVACAESLQLPPIDLQASIRIQDSLELGLSYFMAALARLKAIVDAAERPPRGRVVLYLLDEILQGTNSVERSVAVRGVIAHLLDAGAIGAMTTHDLAVASQPPLDSAARLVHFTELVNADGTMTFDYRLRPGLATSRNALRLMQLMGIDLPKGLVS